MAAIGLLFATPAAGLLTNFPKPLLGVWIIATVVDFVRTEGQDVESR